MKSLFENISDDEYETLEKILNRPDHPPMSFYFDDPTIDGRIRELEKAELIVITNGKLNITELGRAALKEHEESSKKAKHRKRIEILKFVVPTAISLLSLIVSIIALSQT